MSSNYTRCNFVNVTPFLHRKFVGNLWSVWYMCLKTENCYLKTFVEIRVGEKVCRNV